MVDGRRRLIALLFFLLSPAVGGTVLPFLHPCPVDTPWAVSSHQTGHEHHQGAAGHDAGQPCTCPGHGSLPSLAAPPAAVIEAVVHPAPRHQPWAAVEHQTGAVVLDLLPESTAPPVA